MHQRQPRRAAGMRDRASAVLTKTGQLIVLINIRVPSDTHTPVAVIQLPPDLIAGRRQAPGR